MSNSVAQQISLIRSHIFTRRFDAATLLIVESVMVSKDVMEFRSSLREFFRSESMSIMRENAEKPLEKKLLDLEFLVQSFALLGDVESCLALRYEALLLREFKSSSHQWLEVSYTEWLNFAEQSLDYGFHSIARKWLVLPNYYWKTMRRDFRVKDSKGFLTKFIFASHSDYSVIHLIDVKACENALLCFQKNSRTDGKTVECFESLEVIEKLKQLKDCATTLAASHSVQAQAAKYTKSKQIKRSKACSTIGERTQSIASTLFRNGIRKRNLRRLQESQSLLGKTDERNTTEI
ncbi:hypothetical protein L484_011166 [Morus notabilis]|uniref:Uncharacterized protein n=1 Tax=Morus notabilis TaxID=981085 RepID=W9RA32_9ROSA|nr:hypothetical protein L484_011166 [Morus notabilis]